MIVGHSNEEESDANDAPQDGRAQRPLIHGDPKNLEDHDADGRVEEDQHEFHFRILGAGLYNSRRKETPCVFIGEWGKPVLHPLTRHEVGFRCLKIFSLPSRFATALIIRRRAL